MKPRHSKDTKSKLHDWDDRIKILLDYFNSTKLPKEYRLNAWSYIYDVRTFVQRHITIAMHNNGRNVYLPYLERLEEFRNKLLSDADSEKTSRVL